MTDVVAKMMSLWPEIALGIGAVLCLFLGLWPSAHIRRQTVWVAGASIIMAGVLAYLQMIDPRFAGTAGLGITMAGYIKLAVAGVGFLLLLVAAQLPDSITQIAQSDDPANTRKVDPAILFRGEFFAFFLLSLAGVMLVAQADDLVWLFLALELVSLPTYVMVAVSRNKPAAQESAVKYFFLGALAVAIFLYGFALIYGATGVTRFTDIRQFAAMYPANELPPLLLTGLVLAIVGIAFKIAAVPMHFYTADVYQGAATPVTAFLAFVPKVAGFVAIILILSLADPHATGQYPSIITGLLWLLAAFTMTVGNVLGLLQTSVKRVLAYSSIAHTGYMLVGLVAGVSIASSASTTNIGHGIAAVLFYLIAYGLSTIAAFAVLGCLRSNANPDDEADSYDDLAGLAKRKPVLAGVMLLAVLSLVGLPPLVGFLGKIYLFGSAIQQGFIGLVILAVLNSAVSAVYYLRIAGACFFAAPSTQPMNEPALPARQLGATIAALAALVLGFLGGPLVDAAFQAGDRRQPPVTKPLVQFESHSITTLHQVTDDIKP